MEIVEFSLFWGWGDGAVNNRANVWQEMGWSIMYNSNNLGLQELWKDLGASSMTRSMFLRSVLKRTLDWEKTAHTLLTWKFGAQMQGLYPVMLT